MEAHNRSTSELIFAPPKKTALKDCTLTLEVRDLHVPVPVCHCGYIYTAIPNVCINCAAKILC